MVRHHAGFHTLTKNKPVTKNTKNNYASGKPQITPVREKTAEIFLTSKEMITFVP
jgi:hypothetical protein